MSIMRRREFLKLAAAGGCTAKLMAAKEPNISFPTEPRERLAVASYPFRDSIENPRKPGSGLTRMTLAQFPAMVAERYRIHNVELLGDHFPSTDPKYIDGLRAAAEKAGTRIVNLPVSPRASAYVEDGREWVDVAVALGCPSIRVHVRAAGNAAPGLERTAGSLRAIASYGEEKNVVINLENDDPKSEEASFIVKLIELVGSAYLRALPDFCNSMLIGPEQYNYDSMRAMFAHAYNISHVKDSEVDHGKVYRVDVDRTFAIAKASGYRGYFSMEWEGEANPYDGTAKLIEMSLRNLGA
jgi:sugar phosphate isomerase/epimerase